MHLFPRRRRTARLCKFCLIALLACFLGGCVLLFLYDASARESAKPATIQQLSKGTTAPLTSLIVPTREQSKSSSSVSDETHRNTATQVLEDGASLESLRTAVSQLNRMERVLNADRFPVLSSVDGLVVVVQVHRRVGYLHQLIESLRVARGVADILLIVSHDYVSKEINSAVQSIDFCKVLASR